ncbi:MAG: Rieske 2Fe-2S domain-containing protein [Cyclobacteriaceae bacterium]|nr:Rieske 2Fe-2S domain-containing protein [Cyclobacteriaceae bacterium]
MKTIQVKSGNLTNSRRAFLEKSGSVLAMSVFGLSFFTSCSDEEDATPQAPPTGGGSGITVAGNTITIDLNQQTGLANNGGWLLIIEAQTLVVNVGGSYSALTSVCTHSACDRNWSYSGNRFTCSCHGSQFDTEGNVLQGPANRPLERFDTSISNDILTITK